MTPWWRARSWWGLLFAGVLVAGFYGGWQGQSPVQDAVTLLLLVLLYPLLEEVLFRGLLQPAVFRRTGGARPLSAVPLSWANLLVSSLFALTHLWAHGMPHAALVLIPALCFGYCRDRFGTIVPGLLLHVVWNGVLFGLPAPLPAAPG